MAWGEMPTSRIQISHLLGAAAAAGVLGLALWLRKRSTIVLSTSRAPERGDPCSEINSIGLPRYPDLASSASPFVAKVEAWLRFVNLPYVKQKGDFRKAPKGQLPVILHGGNVVADSTYIIKYLRRTYPEAGRQLSQEEEAMSIVLTHFVEKHLHFALAWHRFISPKGWALTRQNLDLGLPQPMRWLVLEYVVRPSLHRSLTCQGIARHSEAEINELLADGLAALSILLGEHKFLLGGAPCVADAAAFGFLDNALYDESLMSPDVPALVRRFPSLVAYTDRIRATYFTHELAWEETT